MASLILDLDVAEVGRGLQETAAPKKKKERKEKNTDGAQARALICWDSRENLHCQKAAAKTRVHNKQQQGKKKKKELDL